MKQLSLFISLLFCHSLLHAQICFRDNPIVYSAATGSTFVKALSSGFLNNDSLPDFAYAVTDHILIKIGDGTGLFSAPQQLTITGIVRFLGIRDMDKDGHDDLVVVENYAVLHILYNDGNGVFTDSVYAQGTLFGSGKMFLDDINADNFPDVIIASYGTSSVSVFLSRAARIFSPASISLPFTPSAAAMGRFNNDTIPDLVFYNGTDCTPYYGNGAGSFIAGNTIGVLTIPDHIGIADMDHDGNTDLIYTSATNAYFAYCNASGTLIHTDSIPFTDIPFRYLYAEDIITYDFDHDNYQELIMPSSWNNDVVVFKNNSGTISVKEYSVTGSAGYATIADVDTDGYADIISIDNATVGYYSVLKGLSGNDFSGAIYINGEIYAELQGETIAAADLNHDGYIDLVTNGFDSLNVLLNDGSGHFSVTRIFWSGLGNPASGSMVAIADFNSDGNMDVALSNYNQEYNIMFGDGTGAFAPPTLIFPAGQNFPDLIVTGKFNNDTLPDLAITVNSGISILLNNGTGTFTVAYTISTNGYVYGITVNDFNEDSLDDIAFVLYQSAGELQLNTGAGNFAFSAGFISCLGGDLISIASGDLDKDGHMDLAYTDYDCTYPDRVIIQYGDGHGLLTPGGTLPVYDSPYHLAIADLNIDGYNDIITNSINGIISVVPNGPNGFSGASYLTSGSVSQSVIAADFNNDQKPDLAFTNVYSNDIGVTLNSVAKIYPSSDITICLGDSALLYVTDTLPGFQWTTGETNDSIYAKNQGSYSVQNFNPGFGTCYASSIVYVKVIQAAPALFDGTNNRSTVCLNEQIILNAVPTGGVFSGPGVTDSTFNPIGLVSGYYILHYVYHDSTGCASPVADHTIFVDNCTIGISEIQVANDVRLSPNPANERMLIEQNGNVLFDLCFVYNSYGKLIDQIKLKDRSSFLNTSSFAPGVYQLMFTNSQLSKQSIAKRISIVR